MLLTEHIWTVTLYNSPKKNTISQITPTFHPRWKPKAGAAQDKSKSSNYSFPLNPQKSEWLKINESEMKTLSK